MSNSNGFYQFDADYFNVPFVVKPFRIPPELLVTTSIASSAYTSGYLNKRAVQSAALPFQSQAWSLISEYNAFIFLFLLLN
jgi:hypothetical protein